MLSRSMRLIWLLVEEEGVPEDMRHPYEESFRAQKITAQAPTIAPEAKTQKGGQAVRRRVPGRATGPAL